jgi:small subunit ribosomal protein S3
MGHKVHPLGFRLGVIRDWQAKWYADKSYAGFLHEDLKIRQAIQSRYNESGISLVETAQQASKVLVTIYTARPGIVIGRGGQRVDEMRLYLEGLIGKRVQLNIQEIQQPELDAYLVARAVAEQIERRVAYRRAMKQSILRTLQAGAKGMRISCAGRLGGAEIARRQVMHQGEVPLHKLRADIDYGFTEARTMMGRIGVKVWIYKGDILPEAKVAEAEEVGIEAELPAPVEEKPAEPAVASAEAEPSTVEEEKPAEPAVASTEAEPSTHPEEEGKVEVTPVAKPRRKRATKPTSDVSMEVEPATPEVEPATSEAESATSEVEPATPIEEEKDVTTQADEISHRS